MEQNLIMYLVVALVVVFLFCSSGNQEGFCDCPCDNKCPFAKDCPYCQNCSYRQAPRRNCPSCQYRN